MGPARVDRSLNATVRMPLHQSGSAHAGLGRRLLLRLLGLAAMLSCAYTTWLGDRCSIVLARETVQEEARWADQDRIGSDLFRVASPLYFFFCVS